MENNELKKVCVKNRMCYYFDDITEIEDFDFDILLDEKSCENILVYDVSYNILIDRKPLCIRFNKVDGFIIVYDGTRYLVLFGPEKSDTIYFRIRYLKSKKIGIAYVFSHNYTGLRIDSYDVLPLGKTLTLHNVVMLLRSVLNKNQFTTLIYS